MSDHYDPRMSSLSPERLAALVRIANESDAVEIIALSLAGAFARGRAEGLRQAGDALVAAGAVEHGGHA